MPTPTEIILSTLPGSSPSERVLLVLCQNEQEASFVELRQQSHAPGLGWFNQSTIRLEPSQVAGLRMALGSSASSGPSPLPKAFRRIEPDRQTATGWTPRVVTADSA